MPPAKNGRRRPSGQSNEHSLSKGKRIASAKQRQKAQRVEEVTFDDAKRAEFLTGFRRRNLERRSEARQKAAKKDRAAQLAMRAEVRASRKRELEMRVAAYRADLGLASDDDDDEWHGFSSSSRDEQDSEEHNTTEKKKKGIWDVEYDDKDKTVSVQVTEL